MAIFISFLVMIKSLYWLVFGKCILFASYGFLNSRLLFILIRTLGRLNLYIHKSCDLNIFFPEIVVMSGMLFFFSRMHSYMVCNIANRNTIDLSTLLLTWYWWNLKFCILNYLFKISIRFITSCTFLDYSQLFISLDCFKQPATSTLLQN